MEAGGTGDGSFGEGGGFQLDEFEGDGLQRGNRQLLRRRRRGEEGKRTRRLIEYLSLPSRSGRAPLVRTTGERKRNSATEKEEKEEKEERRTVVVKDDKMRLLELICKPRVLLPTINLSSHEELAIRVGEEFEVLYVAQLPSSVCLPRLERKEARESE
jgi:hypothetical protein